VLKIAMIRPYLLHIVVDVQKAIRVKNCSENTEEEQMSIIALNPLLSHCLLLWFHKLEQSRTVG
jgi:hypothetical protein